MKLASIKRIQVQSLARKRKQDVMYSMHLKRQKLITKFADRSSVEAQAKDIEEKVVIEVAENAINEAEKRLDDIDRLMRLTEMKDQRKKELEIEEDELHAQLKTKQTELSALRSDNRMNMLLSVAVFIILYAVYVMIWGAPNFDVHESLHNG